MQSSCLLCNRKTTLLSSAQHLRGRYERQLAAQICGCAKSASNGICSTRQPSHPVVKVCNGPTVHEQPSRRARRQLAPRRRKAVTGASSGRAPLSLHRSSSSLQKPEDVPLNRHRKHVAAAHIGVQLRRTTAFYPHVRRRKPHCLCTELRARQRSFAAKHSRDGSWSCLVRHSPTRNK